MPAAALTDSRDDRKRRTAFRVLRAKRQTGTAALVLAAGYAAIIIFNVITEGSSTIGDYVPNLLSIVILLAGAWLYSRPTMPAAVLPWIGAVVAVALVLLLLVETSRDPGNPSVEYALIIMVVFSQFVLSFPAAITAAVPMLAGYVVVATDVGVADVGDCFIIGLTALAVGMVALGLRIRLADSLAIALDTAEALATHDSLTGVLNRRGLIDHMPGLLANASRRGDLIAIAFVDIDGMKPINDTHGHATGDEVVRIVAASLTSTSRAGDLVARWGGDEFVVVAPAEHGLDRDAWITRLSGGVRDAAAGHSAWDGSVTVGIASGPADVSDWQSLVERADDDMYARKRGQ